MVMSITNARAVQPYVPVGKMVVKSNAANTRIPSIKTTVTAVALTEYVLTDAVYHINHVSIYVDGFRLINFTNDFGVTHQAYTIVGNKIVFNAPVTGELTIFNDRPFKDKAPFENTLTMSNVQGSKTKNIVANTMLASTYCEPLILTLPVHGSVCLSDDRKSIVYFPDNLYEGFDAFSYTVISDRGQVADPKCVNIKVGNAKPTKG